MHSLLYRENLGRYYELRDAQGAPAAEAHASRRDLKWLELVEESLRHADGYAHVVLDVQGLHCIGCVWLIEEVFQRAALGRGRIVVNPSLGRLDLWVKGDFALTPFIVSVERFGYLFGPPIKRAAPASRSLIARLGFCAAIAMNSMIFGIAMYAGLDHGPLFSLFTTLNFALGTLAVAVGGSVFFASAFRALRQGIIHLDLPIALGVALSFLGSAYSYFNHRSQGSYFDTLDVFITLMLLGRYLQERVLERNRAWLLANEGVEGLLTRRIEHGRVLITSAASLKCGDTLLIAPGDLVPVDAVLEGGGDSFSLDWIQGESRPRTYAPGGVVPAGAFAAGRQAATLRTVSDFASGSLSQLLREPERSGVDASRSSAWWQRLSQIYVLCVLGVATTALVAWWTATHDWTRALGVATAVLIVTCPCAFGIAAPLAYEMAQAGLRRRGLFVRRASFLDRARSVRRVVFDKTGTLTTGALVLANPQALMDLSGDARQVLYDLVARSGHPKSGAIREALDGYASLAIRPEVTVFERPGLGMEARIGAQIWRLGGSAWAAPDLPTDPACDVIFARDGRPVAALRTREQLRPDAVGEIQRLQADGYEVWLLSGDAQARVIAAGVNGGVDPWRCVGDQMPHEKAAFLRSHDRRDTLFVGDGVNDAVALDEAHTSGTPAVDRPYVPARADFFFVTAGLGPIRLALRTSRALAQVVRVDLAIALAYNALTVGLAVCGRMSPLACAVLMPLSSLTTIFATVVSLSPRSRLWKS